MLIVRKKFLQNPKFSVHLRNVTSYLLKHETCGCMKMWFTTMDTKQLGQFIEQLEQLPTLIDPRLALAAALPGPLFPIDS